MLRNLSRRCALAAVLAAGLGLSGCAAPMVGALTIGEVFSIAGLGSTIMTGRDLTEHAVSMITGKDCRFLETLLRNGRSFCETPGSVATSDDFHGVVALVSENKPTQTASAANLDPDVLGFAPVDRRAAEDFSLEIARKHPAQAEMLSFGMLSATFGSSYTYELNIRGASGATAKFADATPAPTAPTELRPGRVDYSGL
jgi:hypothetical protein